MSPHLTSPRPTSGDPPDSTRDKPAAAGRLWALVTAIGCVAGVVIIARIAVGSPTGQRYDEHAMASLYSSSSGTIVDWIGLITVQAVGIGLALAVVIAIAQRRVRDAVMALIVIAAANATTQVVKHVILPRPDYGFGDLNSLPSGHTTVITTLVIAALLVVPAAARPLVSCLGALAISVLAASVVIADHHRISDVVAGMAISLAWASVAIGAVPRGDGKPARQQNHRKPYPVFAPALVGATASIAVLAAIGVRPLHGWHSLPEVFIVLGAIVISSTLTIALCAQLWSHRASRRYPAARARP